MPKNETMRAAAIMASDLYAGGMAGRTLTVSVQYAAVKHKVTAESLLRYLAGAGARAIWGGEVAPSGTVKPARRSRGEAALQRYEKNFLCAAYGEGCRQ